MVKMARGTHDHEIDHRNAEILININGELFPRDEAKISVFDSGFILGDGVWEGLRLHNGKLLLIDQHLFPTRKTSSHNNLVHSFNKISCRKKSSPRKFVPWI